MSGGLLLLCYGNPGRLDDGLGAAFAEAVEKSPPEGVTVEVNYQLMIEDAARIAEHDAVVFVDAAVVGPEPFDFRVIEGSASRSFSTHSILPEEVLGLARELFGSQGKGYVLAIRGYVFEDFGEALSKRAKENLSAALDFFAQFAERVVDSTQRAERVRW